ncbi:MAG TPA: transporter [Candidatus Omnitrophota bacterium]|nr:transporter [Candidatus Omnitrophota bacterium]
MKTGFRGAIAIFILGVFFPAGLFAAAKENRADTQFYHEPAIKVEPAKLILIDATPVDPGRIEENLSYSIQGAGKQWKTSGRRIDRKSYMNHAFDSNTNIGICRGLDIGITQGISILRDKENNYDETGGETDPATGESLDETDGPHKGHGLSDLLVNARWVFYHSPDQSFRLAYIPSVLIPTGRRGNLDHLGPSQGYTGLGNILAVTKDFSRWTASGNLGYEVPLGRMKKTGNSAGTLTTAWGAGYHVFGWLQPQAEVIYSQSFEKHGNGYGKGSKLFSMAFGFIMPVNGHLRFDVGLVQDIAGSNTDQTTSGIFKVVITT